MRGLREFDSEGSFQDAWAIRAICARTLTKRAVTHSRTELAILDGAASDGEGDRSVGEPGGLIPYGAIRNGDCRAHPFRQGGNPKYAVDGFRVRKP